MRPSPRRTSAGDRSRWTALACGLGQCWCSFGACFTLRAPHLTLVPAMESNLPMVVVVPVIVVLLLFLVLASIDSRLSAILETLKGIRADAAKRGNGEGR